MNKALIIMEMQYDFCEGGPIPHANSLNIIPIINKIRNDFNFVIFVNDCHPNNHCSFKNFGGNLNKHCVFNMPGSKIHDGLLINDKDLIINKGTLQKYDTTSAFFDAESIDRPTKLKDYLKMNKITELYFCGNGLDETIFSTLIDAVNYRYKCYVIKNAITYLNKDTYSKCVNYLKTIDVNFI